MRNCGTIAVPPCANDAYTCASNSGFGSGRVSLGRRGRQHGNTNGNVITMAAQAMAAISRGMLGIEDGGVESVPESAGAAGSLRTDDASTCANVGASKSSDVPCKTDRQHEGS